MNPCVSLSCSSGERGNRGSWVCESSSWENNPPVGLDMSVGLESARQFTGRVDWDWENPTPANNPSMLLSHRFHHHEQSDSEDQKPQITAPASSLSFRQYNGMGLGMGFSHHHPHHHQALSLLNSSGIRSFSHDGIPSTTSFHPGLLYSDVSGFGAGAYDSRSQLFGMMSLQDQQQHQKETAAAGTIFHDIVKREDVCPGEFQTRIGLNLGHRTYFSTEDTALSRLYKRPRAVPAASQVPRCQAEGCNADLSNTKPYHRRHKVCEYHSKATSVVTGGLQQRFCQQCSRFHVLSEFDEVKRSCRKRLADHNRRRRKQQPNAVVPATSSSPEPLTAPLKSAEGESTKNKPDAGCNDTRGVGVTESQALMNAMSLPLMLQNPNPNPNPTNSSPSPTANTTLLQQNSVKVSSLQQYPAAQKGPNLSMGLCNNQRQTSSDYSGLELALPWLRPSSDYSGGSSHRPSNSPPMDILQPIISEKADVEGFSSPVQNFLSASSSRELGATSQWMVGNTDNTEHQHMFSLLESPAVRTEDNTAHQPPVEYLSHRRHQGGLNSKDTVEGHSDSTKFSDLQSLRRFGQSIYDSNL